MLLGIHIAHADLPALRARIAESEAFARVRETVAAFLAGPNPFDRTKPGLLNSAEVDPYSLGHLGAALSAYHILEPTTAVEAALVDFLRWIPAQESLMWGQNISLGQFLKGAILALEAIGETLAADARRALLEHLILTCIANPDPAALPNNHPTGAQDFPQRLPGNTHRAIHMIEVIMTRRRSPIMRRAGGLRTTPALRHPQAHRRDGGAVYIDLHRRFGQQPRRQGRGAAGDAGAVMR